MCVGAHVHVGTARACVVVSGGGARGRTLPACVPMASCRYFFDHAQKPADYARLVYEGVYRELAVPLKGGIYRDVGLAMLEAAVRDVPPEPKADASLSSRSLRRMSSALGVSSGELPVGDAAQVAPAAHKSE